MNDEAAQNQGFAQVLEGIHPKHLTPAAKKRFAQLARRLDDLGRRDKDSQQVFVDETALRTLLHEFYPPEFEERCIAEMRTFPDSRLMSSTDVERGKMIPIRWQALCTQVGLLTGEPDPAFKDRLNKVSKVEDIRQAVKQHFPDIPDEMFDPQMVTQRVQQIVGSPAQTEERTMTAAALSSASQVFDCVMRNLGWWAAFALLTIIGAALVAISVATGGTATVPAAWVIFWILTGFGLAAGTIAIIGNCIINPWR